MTGRESPPFPDIDQYVATNLREFRERQGLSQEELANRMTERGFAFSQATIWKIESAQRSARASEVVALAQSLDLTDWIRLTAEPGTGRLFADVLDANRAAFQSYEALKAAAAKFLRAQINLSLIIQDAEAAGILAGDHPPFIGWLETPAERAIMEARVEAELEEEMHEQIDAKVNVVMQALQEHGYRPPLPGDWVCSGPPRADDFDTGPATC